MRRRARRRTSSSRPYSSRRVSFLAFIFDALRLAPGDQAGLFMQALSQIRGCRLAAAVWSALALTGCESIAKRQLSEGLMPPIVAPITELNMSLRTLPPPDRKVVVAVYNYA